MGVMLEKASMAMNRLWKAILVRAQKEKTSVAESLHRLRQYPSDPEQDVPRGIGGKGSSNRLSWGGRENMRDCGNFRELGPRRPGHCTKLPLSLGHLRSQGDLWLGSCLLLGAPP